MPDAPYDFLVAGDAASAGLLALELSETHGARVAYVGRPVPPYAVPRDVSLSVGPYTRPETWKLLEAARQETLALIARAGGQTETCSAEFAARSVAGKRALGHIRHMMTAHGHITIVAPAAGDRSAFSLARAERLDVAALWSSLPDKLSSAGVRHVVSGARLRRIGKERVRFVLEGEEAIADRLVIAGDTAWNGPVHPDLPPDVAPASQAAMMAVSGSPARPSTLCDIEMGGVVVKDAAGRWTASVPATGITDAQNWLSQQLTKDETVRLTGRAAFNTLTSTTGGGLVGQVSGKALWLALGLGLSEVFFMPAVARYLAGTASDFENDYFAARAPGGDRTVVADVCSRVAGSAA